MSGNSDGLNVGRRGFIAGSVTAAGYLTVGKNSGLGEAPAPPVRQTWEIIMTPDPVTKKIKYDSNPWQADAKNLKVSVKELVRWRAHTSGAHHHLVIMLKTVTPFVDDMSLGRVYGFYGSDADETGTTSDIGKGTHIGAVLSAVYEFEYSVLIFDEDSGKTYVEDPKIIIATVSVNAEVIREELIETHEELKGIVSELGSIEEKLGRLIKNKRL